MLEEQDVTRENQLPEVNQRKPKSRKGVNEYATQGENRNNKFSSSGYSCFCMDRCKSSDVLSQPHCSSLKG